MINQLKNCRTVHVIAAVALTAAAMMLPARHLSAQTSTVVVRDAWVREVAAGRAVTGAFMILENTGTTARALVRGAASVGVDGPSKYRQNEN